MSVWTVIILMPSGKYHVGLTDDPETYLKKKQDSYRAGFFHHKDNVEGQARIVRAFRGDYHKKVKAFGGKALCEMLDSEDVFVEILINLVQ